MCYFAYFFFIIASIILKWEAANSYITLDFSLLDFSFLLVGPIGLIFYFGFYFYVYSFAFSLILLIFLIWFSIGLDFWTGFADL